MGTKTAAKKTAADPRMTGRTADCITAKDLARFGFAYDSRHSIPACLRHDNADKTIRVFLEGEEGIEVIGFTPAPAFLCAWSVRFGAQTPIRLVLATIEAANMGHELLEVGS